MVKGDFSRFLSLAPDGRILVSSPLRKYYCATFELHEIFVFQGAVGCRSLTEKQAGKGPDSVAEITVPYLLGD
jgi:hypothetical protein